MTTWKFSDGTTAKLGGIVEGGSLFAQELRAEIAQGRLRVPVAMPNIGHKVDVNDLALFDAWLQHEAGRPFRKPLTIIAAPENIPELPKLPGQDAEPVEGTVY
jgi:hypothetical protein